MLVALSLLQIAAISADPPSPPREKVLETTPVVPIEGRRRPGQQRDLPDRITQENPGAVRPPPPEAFGFASLTLI